MSKRPKTPVLVEPAGGLKTWSALRDFWGRLRDPGRDVEFDRTWGVTTCGRIAPTASDVVGPNWVHGAEYQGCNAPALGEVLRELMIPYEQFTFIDFGSGKGRALLVAAHFPFRQVIGVEYSAPLTDIARRNLSRFPPAAIHCQEIAVVHADAASFPIPDGPLVLFFFNPFDRPVMRAVVENVVTSYNQSPRRILVLYSNPVYADVWGNVSFLESIPSPHKWMAMYDTPSRFWTCSRTRGPLT
jgi:SAM-dependent methyltransferase